MSGSEGGTMTPITGQTPEAGSPEPAATEQPAALAGRRALLVGSSGGHLAQLMPLAPLWESADRRWVMFDTPDARSRLSAEKVTWAFSPTTRNIPNLLRNMWLAVSIISSWRPDVVVSTGAGVALPFFVVAHLRRIPTVYVEVYDRVDSRTLTGRLCKPFTSTFCVQWPEQQALYRGSRVVGPLL